MIECEDHDYDSYTDGDGDGGGDDDFNDDDGGDVYDKYDYDDIYGINSDQNYGIDDNGNDCADITMLSFCL